MCRQVVTYQSSTECKLLKAPNTSPSSETPLPIGSTTGNSDTINENKAATFRPWYSYLFHPFANESVKQRSAGPLPVRTQPHPSTSQALPTQREQSRNPHRVKNVLILQCLQARQNDNVGCFDVIEGHNVCQVLSPMIKAPGKVVKQVNESTESAEPCQVCDAITVAEETSMMKVDIELWDLSSYTPQTAKDHSDASKSKKKKEKKREKKKEEKKKAGKT